MWGQVLNWLPVLLAAYLFEISTRSHVEIRPLDLSCRFAELAGEFKPNTNLRHVARQAVGDAKGPETVLIDTRGDIYFFCEDGWLRTMTPDGSVAETVYIGGRPLGGAFDLQDNLIVAEPTKGLIMIPRHSKPGEPGSIRILSNHVTNDSSPIRFANDVAVAQDGTIYFSDSSTVAPTVAESGIADTLSASVVDILSGSGTGRLLKYNPRDGATTTLLSGLSFANGVSIAPDESYVAVVETFRFQVRRYWLKGNKAGMTDIVINETPGMPDGLTIDENGRFWVPIVSPGKFVKAWHDPVCVVHPASALDVNKRRVYEFSPDVLGASSPLQRHVIAIDKVTPAQDGEVVTTISSAVYHKGKIYLGSLKNQFIAVIDDTEMND